MQPGLQVAAAGQIDVIVLDMNLPDSTGLSTLRASLQCAPTVPIVVLSGLDDEMAGIEAVQCGAQDYLVKGRIDGELLFHVLRYAIERKRLEGQANERLREAHQAKARLAAALGSMSEGFCQLDKLGRIIYMNPAGLQLLGYEYNELLNCNIHTVVHPCLPTGTERLVEDCLMCNAIRAGVNYVNSEDNFTGKNKLCIPVEYSVSPFLLEDEIEGSVLCFRDITERKVAEVRVKEFYSTVSHELRTPLTSIRGALALIEGGLTGVVPPQTLELVGIAHESALRLNRIVDDILDIRKIEECDLKLHCSEIDCADLVKVSLDGMLGMASQCRVQLINQGNMSVKLAGDKDRLIQVITNLVSNAVKFSEPGNSVSLKVVKLQPNRVRFNIIDQGMGIPPDQLHKLFVRFQQVDSSDSRPRGGTGLGLAIAKAIVEEHGGQIGVESMLNVGSTFWFELPSLPSVSHA